MLVGKVRALVPKEQDPVAYCGDERRDFTDAEDLEPSSSEDLFNLRNYPSIFSKGCIPTPTPCNSALSTFAEGINPSLSVKLAVTFTEGDTM